MTGRTTSKIAFLGAGGVTGLTGIANVAVIIACPNPDRTPPIGLWLLMIAAVLATTALTVIAMIFRHLEGESYRTLLAAAACKPEWSLAFLEVIDADSRHEAVMAGGILTDKHQKLYRSGVRPRPGS
jgi:hypothetical protein